MKSKLKILLLVLLLAATHGVAQILLSGAGEIIGAHHPFLKRTATAALRVSTKPAGASWRNQGFPGLPAWNSLLWGVGLCTVAGALVKGARKCGWLTTSRLDAATFKRILLSGRRFLLNHEAFVPVLALLFASAMSVGLVLVRILWTGNVRNGFLIWNLILAWMPLLFALLAREHYQDGIRRNWRFLGLAGAWLLFFPNAPYIFTDVIHLTRGLAHYFWVDLTLILICALTGFVLGFVSLYLMQSLVARAYGRVASWLFVVVVAGLSGFGIYLGRILRLNSWDIVVRPTKLYHGVNAWVADPLANLNTFAFPALFATFLFIAYVMLYALTHLQPAHNAAGVGGGVKLAEA